MSVPQVSAAATFTTTRRVGLALADYLETSR